MSAPPRVEEPDQRSFRDLLGHYATGVVLLTASSPDGPVGIAANSFASLSLDPPLVSFGIARTSTTWPSLRSNGAIAVNILHADHQDLTRVFSAKDVDRFAGFQWETSPSGHPLVPGCLGWIECVIESEHEGGDHQLVVARAIHWSTAESGSPLVFFGGRFHRLPQEEAPRDEQGAADHARV